MTFPCRACGACCRRIGRVPAKTLEQNGLTADENGHCIHLDGDLCTIYAMRPDICRVKGNHHQSAMLCNAWMAEDGRTDFIRLEEIR